HKQLTTCDPLMAELMPALATTNSLQYIDRTSLFIQAEDGIRDGHVTGVQTCALPIWKRETGNVETRQQCQQVVRVLTDLREPHPNGGQVSRIGVLVPPLSDCAAPLDVPVRDLETRQQRRRI